MAAWEAMCLSCDPFAGDFEGSGSNDRLLADKMVTARTKHDCHACAGPVNPGERARSRREVYDGEMMAHYWCEACCRAMALSDDETYAARVALGDKRRAALRKEMHRIEDGV